MRACLHFVLVFAVCTGLGLMISCVWIWKEGKHDDHNPNTEMFFHIITSCVFKQLSQVITERKGHH